MKLSEKSEIEIPKKIIIIIIVIFVGLGIQGAIYAFRYFNDNSQIDSGKAQNFSKNIENGKSISITGVKIYREMGEYQIVTDSGLLMPLGWEKSQPKAEPVIEPRTVIRESSKEMPRPNKSLVLTGITELNNELMALMEDVSGNRAYYLKKGDTLKNYMVEEIMQDKIILTNGESKIKTHLGSSTVYNSDGILLASASSYDFESSDTKTELDTSVDSDAKLSLIERMKARRKRELGKE